jgi:hypothetical protein
LHSRTGSSPSPARPILWRNHLPAEKFPANGAVIYLFVSTETFSEACPNLLSDDPSLRDLHSVSRAKLKWTITHALAEETARDAVFFVCNAIK